MQNGGLNEKQCNDLLQIWIWFLFGESNLLNKCKESLTKTCKIKKSGGVLQNSLYVILQEPRNSAGLMSGILI